MRQATEPKIQTQSTIGSFKQATVHPSQMKLVIKDAINKYTLQKDAVLREIVSNGYDAQIEHGVDTPINIALPTLDHPMLVISDCGIGMNAADLERAYGSLYDSDKYESDDAIGHFGIGSKSPLGVADQFYIHSVKDGVETVMLYSYRDGDIPGMTIISETPTEKSNGTTVSIPIDITTSETLTEWDEAAQRVFFWWSPTQISVTVGNQPWVHHYYRDYRDEALSTDRITVLNKTHRSTSIMPAELDKTFGRGARTATIGPVGYSVHPSLLDYEIPHNFSVVYHFDIDQGIAITSAREHLDVSDQTKSLIKHYTEHWRTEMVQRHTPELESATTSVEIRKRYGTIPQDIHFLLNVRKITQYIDDRDLPLQMGQSDYHEVVPLQYTLDNPRIEQSMYTSDMIRLLTDTKRPVFFLNLPEEERQTKKRYPYRFRRDQDEPSQNEEDASFTVRHNIAARTSRIIQQWRRGTKHYADLIVVPGKELISNFVDVDSLNWVTVEQLQQETPKQPKPVTGATKRSTKNPENKTFKHQHIWHHYGPGGSAPDEITQQKLASYTQPFTLVVGSTPEYREVQDSYGHIMNAYRVIDRYFTRLRGNNKPQNISTPEQLMDNVVTILRGPYKQETYAKMFPKATVITPESFVEKLRASVVTQMTPSQRQHVANGYAITKSNYDAPGGKQEDTGTVFAYMDALPSDVRKVYRELWNASLYPNTRWNTDTETRLAHMVIQNDPKLPQENILERYPTAFALGCHMRLPLGYNDRELDESTVQLMTLTAHHDLTNNSTPTKGS